MKITEADIIWTPADADVPTAGAVRIERHTGLFRQRPLAEGNAP
jgi:hypothetical protein